MSKQNDYSLAVIIPSYNKASYLRQCLDSVLSQSLLPDEIIAVDDCSTDSSREIIAEYAKKYDIVKPLLLEQNGGVSNARNKGLEYANTSYVSFIDADDFYYNTDKLKNEMALIRSFKERGKDITAYSVVARVDKTGALLPAKRNRKWHKSQFVKGKSLVTLLSMTKQGRVPRDYCISKAVLQEVGAYSFYKNFYEDLDLLMRIAESGTEFYCTYEYGTAYRQTEGGLSKLAEAEHNKTVSEITGCYYKRLSAAQRLECCLRKATHRLFGKLKKLVMLPWKSTD